MAEIRYNNQAGTLGASLTSSGTTITFTSAPDFATLSGGNYIKLALDAGTARFEIVYLTAYTSGGTTGTITRAAEDSTNWSATSHSSGTGTWACVPTIQDYPGGLTASPWLTHVSYGTSGLTSYNLTSTYGALDTTNLTLPFVAPPSGTVVAGANIYLDLEDDGTPGHSCAARVGFTDHSTGNPSAASATLACITCVSASYTLTDIGLKTYRATVSGLTPGASYQWDLAAGTSNGDFSFAAAQLAASHNGVTPAELFIWAA